MVGCTLWQASWEGMATRMKRPAEASCQVPRKNEANNQQRFFQKQPDAQSIIRLSLPIYHERCSVKEQYHGPANVMMLLFSRNGRNRMLKGKREVLNSRTMLPSMSLT